MKSAYLKFDPSKTQAHISRNIYGHFTEHLGRCIYNGVFVGKDSTLPNKDGIRTDVVDALKAIGTPVLRWPGGCFADEYHWKEGVGETRTPVLNTNWGGVVEDNSFGTHEFFELCDMVGCDPYIAGNLGSGTPRELAEWLEYMTSWSESPLANERRKNGRSDPWEVKFLGIGNENWGCGGNMTPEYYADEYRRYAQFAKCYHGSPVKVACGPNADDYNWTEVMMQKLNKWQTGALSLHYYTVPTGNWDHKGAALTFDEKEYYQTMKSTLYMDTIITGHSRIMDKYDPDRDIRLIVDEWGCWYDVEEGTDPGFLYQQNTLRDAIVAAVNLNIFNAHAERVMMANLAQAVNVLQAVVLTEGERLVKTPTWQVFKMYLPHHESERIRTSLSAPTIDAECGEIPMISQSMSVKDGKVFLTVTNLSLTEDCELLLDPEVGSICAPEAKIINSADIHDYNDFDGTTPVTVKDYSGFTSENGRLKLIVPAHSVVSVSFGSGAEK